MPLVHKTTAGAPALKQSPRLPDISLTFGSDVDARVHARMSYAFRVFAAIYGHKVVDAGSTPQALQCVYGRPRTLSDPLGTLFIPARYRLRTPGSPARIFVKHPYAGEEIYLAYGVDDETGQPDWLGEIFEWLSSSNEMNIFERDSVGRIPYSETIFTRQHVDPRRPHANLLAAWMENALQGSRVQALPKPASHLPGIEHVVLCSHDIDFYYTDRMSALTRILKNLVLSWTLYRSRSFFEDNLRYLLRLLGGKPVGDYLPPLMNGMEQLGHRSTFFAVSQRRHRRDPNYEVPQIAYRLVEAARRGFSVALHASYESVLKDKSLREESQALACAVEQTVQGSRQHWLRYDLQQTLIAEMDRAGLLFDSSFGFAEVVGFRHGAAFAFPPYDFQKEGPCGFLEFPLVLMDGNLEAACRASGESPQDVADQVLDESRRWGWGGVSILWHDPLESLQVPREINHVFWNCAKKQNAFQEKWISTDHFFYYCLQRYQNAGLLDNVTIPSYSKRPALEHSH